MLTRELLPLLIGASFAIFAAADTGGDISSLVSELGPLLSLFGELPTTQFMSQALGWADNIILSMAPLGIITIIIAAIRVGGPSWFRSLIGRSREGRAEVEAELMSSTSDEVCELWDGEQVVRMVGEGTIREFVILVPRGIARNYSTNTSLANGTGNTSVDSQKSDPYMIQNIQVILKDAEREGYPGKLEKHEPTIREWVHGQRSQAGKHCNGDDEDDVSSVFVVRNTQNAPNITLNCHHQFARGELYLVAVLSIVLQLGVLIYSGCATYYPHFLFFLNGDRVAKYAYPCTATGTLVLVIGMLICSNIVESSTDEERYCPASGKEARVVWLQRSDIVKEESLRPHAIFPRKAQTLITTSRRQEKSEEQHKKITGSSSHDSKHRPDGAQTVKTLIGVSLGICGFVVQFIGLRSMHWSASVAQLGAVVVMTILRAWVRRSLAEPPNAQPLYSGHELDWLAMTLGGDLTKAPWLLHPSGLDWEQTRRPWAGGGKGSWDWEILAVDVRAHCEKQKREEQDKNSILESKADKVMKIRRNLGKLAGWHGPASEEAISLARSIEKTMDALQFTSEQTFIWSLKTSKIYGGEPIHFRLDKLKTGAWKAYSDQVEAALSLWLYSVHDRESKPEVNDTDTKMQTIDKIPGEEEVDQTRSQERAIQIPSPDDDDEWLRAKRMRPKHSLRFLSSYTDSLYQDFEWWSPNGTDSVIEVTESEPTTGTNLVELDTHRIVGYVANSSLTPTEQDGKYRYQVLRNTLGKDASDQPGNARERVKVILAAQSYGPLKALYAQHMFSTFMWAVADTMKTRIPGKVDIRPIETGDIRSQSAWKSFTLHNSQLSKLAQDIQSTGLGTFEEIYLCMIPPLSVRQKLPSVDGIISWTRENARIHEQLGRWKEAGDVYMWLVRKAKIIEDNDISNKAFAFLAEHLRAMTDAIKLREIQQFEDEDVQELKGLESHLLQELRGHGKGYLLVRLQKIFELQKRPWVCDLAEKLKLSEPLPDSNIVDLPYHYSHMVTHINSEEIRRCTHKQDILDWTTLHYAATYNSLRSLREGLFHLADLNAQDIRGRTPLHYACWKDYTNLAEFLLHKGADVSLQDTDGLAPIHYAVTHSNEKLLRLLIERGARIDLADNLGHTPLLWAAYKGKKAAVDCLWKDANRNLRDHNSRTHLHLAAMAEANDKARKQVVALLLQQGAEREARDKFGQTPLHCAAKSGHKDVVALLVEKGNIEAQDSYGQTALHCAAAKGHEAVVLSLLRSRAEKEAVDNSRWTALHHAAEKGHEAVVRLLLENGADIHAIEVNRKTALHYAAEKGHEAVVRLLLENGANTHAIEQNGITALHYAARKGHMVVARLLLQSGAEVKAMDNGHWTALHYAAGNGYTAIVELLLQSSAEADAMTGDHWTALHYAAKNGYTAIVEFLLQSGANKEAVTNDRRTALHCAAQNGHKDVVQLLLDKGVNKDAMDDSDCTPLYMAVDYWHPAVVQLLVDNGADTDITKKNNRTARIRDLYEPDGRRRLEMVKLLKSHGTKSLHKSP